MFAEFSVTAIFMTFLSHLAAPSRNFATESACTSHCYGILSRRKAHTMTPTCTKTSHGKNSRTSRRGGKPFFQKRKKIDQFSNFSLERLFIALKLHNRTQCRVAYNLLSLIAAILMHFNLLNFTFPRYSRENRHKMTENFSGMKLNQDFEHTSREQNTLPVEIVQWNVRMVFVYLQLLSKRTLGVGAGGR